MRDDLSTHIVRYLEVHRLYDEAVEDSARINEVSVLVDVMDYEERKINSLALHAPSVQNDSSIVVYTVHPQYPPDLLSGYHYHYIDDHYHL